MDFPDSVLTVVPLSGQILGFRSHSQNARLLNCQCKIWLEKDDIISGIHFLCIQCYCLLKIKIHLEV